MDTNFIILVLVIFAGAEFIVIGYLVKVLSDNNIVQAVKIGELAHSLKTMLPVESIQEIINTKKAEAKLTETPIDNIVTEAADIVLKRLKNEQSAEITASSVTIKPTESTPA